MNRCRLCQQICNNLTVIYNNRLKSLIQVILKLKGFKGSWDLNSDLTVCAKCIKGVENVALFWENIPEAKTDTAELPGDLKEPNATVAFRMEQNLPALKLNTDQKYDHEDGTSEEKKLDPIKLSIKLPRKRKKKENCNTNNNTSTELEPLQKRTRRLPQRYDDFQLNSNKSTSAWKEESSFLIEDSDACNKTSFNDLPQIALLRLGNSQHVGTLAEVESQGLASKIRISCHICCQLFRVERVFQKHLKTHFPIDLEQTGINLENYLYHCKLCDKPFSNHRSVRNHFKLAHSEDRHFKCLHCEASFKYKFNLNYHISTKHVPKKRFECTFCKKMFLMRYELQIHVRTHTKERPYKCELCSFAFAHKSNLKTHQRAKHFESSTKTALLRDVDNNEKSTISGGKFIPPEHLIEPEEEILSKKTANFEQLTEKLLEQENAFRCDFVNVEQSDTLCEQIKLHKEQKASNSHLNISESAILTNFENLEDRFVTEVLKAEDYRYINIPSSTTEAPKLEDNKILRRATAAESSEGFFKAQPILGVFQLDSSLFQVLPTANLLGLKKWPKSYQSTPNNQLQLVKSSKFFNNHNVNEFERNKTLKGFKEKVEFTLENSSGSINSFITSSQLADDNTPANSLHQSALDSNSSDYSLATKNPGVSLSNEKLIEVPNHKDFTTISWEQNNLGDVNKLKAIEINSNKSCSEMSIENNASLPWKEIKVSSRPIKVKYITNSTQSSKTSATKSNSNLTTQTANENFASKEIAVNNLLANVTTNTNENISNSLETFKILTSATSQSLLKPIAKLPPATSLSFTTASLNQTLLHNKPLITSIEILPPLKQLTTSQNSPPGTSLIKPPVEYKFQCSYCYKYFKQKSPLTKHLRTHTGEKPYKCTLCPKSYADASNFKKHKILHKNAADTLIISGNITTYTVQSSPAYSTVSDPDPDGIEVMQTLRKFECSSTEDDDIEDNDSDASNRETQMWQDALDQALNSEEIRANIRTSLMGISNAILPNSMQQISYSIESNKKFPTHDDVD